MPGYFIDNRDESERFHNIIDMWPSGYAELTGLNFLNISFDTLSHISARDLNAFIKLLVDVHHIPRCTLSFKNTYITGMLSDTTIPVECRFSYELPSNRIQMVNWCTDHSELNNFSNLQVRISIETSKATALQCREDLHVLIKYLESDESAIKWKVDKHTGSSISISTLYNNSFTIQDIHELLSQTSPKDK